MSFPTIPDITPDLDIDFCDAVNLLLASIALEEISLSKLMDAQKDNIRWALSRCKCGGCPPEDIIAVNESAEDMMKTLIKLQMLLQFKLENVQELTPCGDTTTTTTTTSTTTTSTTCTRSTTCPCCCLIGTGRGCVQNRQDPFYGHPFSLHVFLPGKKPHNAAIRYTAGGEHTWLSFHASGPGAVTEAPCCRQDTLSLRGTGRLRRSGAGAEELCESAAYVLTIRREYSGRSVFRIQLTSQAQSPSNTTAALSSPISARSPADRKQTWDRQTRPHVCFDSQYRRRTVPHLPDKWLDFSAHGAYTSGN